MAEIPTQKALRTFYNALQDQPLEPTDRYYVPGLHTEEIGGAWEETPGALRDLSVSLDRVGDVARELGQLERAEQAYREGLEVARRVLAARGQTPEALRDVGVSLDRVGETARELGRLEESEAAYREGETITRFIRDQVGDSREVLDDLAEVLTRSASTLTAAGRTSEARDKLSEARALLARLRLVFPEHAEYADRMQTVEALLKDGST